MHLQQSEKIHHGTKIQWVLAQAHEHASTVVMTVRCIMEAWNKHNPLTEHYFEETTRLLTCLNLFYQK